MGKFLSKAQSYCVLHKIGSFKYSWIMLSSLFSTFVPSFQALTAGTVPFVVRTSSVHLPAASSCPLSSSSVQHAASSGSRNWHEAGNKHIKVGIHMDKIAGGKNKLLSSDNLTNNLLSRPCRKVW